MEEVGRLLIFTILSGITLTALILVLGALFPKATLRQRELAEHSTGRAFLLGLVNTIFLLAIFLVFVALGENLGIQLLFLPAILVLAVFLIGAFFGLTSMTQLLGKRLFSAHNNVRRNLYGSALLILACLTPYVGWFALLPYLLILSLGLFIFALFQRPGRTTSVPEEAEEN